MAAVQLQNPARHVVEEVAVVGHGIITVPLYCCRCCSSHSHALGIKVVGRFVEQQHIGLLQQQAAQGHPALLAAREVADDGLLRRGAEGIHGPLQLAVEVPGVELVEALLHRALPFEQFVEIRVLGPEGFVNFIVLL